MQGTLPRATIAYMSWIDEDNAELQRLRESAAELSDRNSQIANSGERIYNDLWREVTERITEAKRKGNHYAAALITNGDTYERRILNHRLVVPQPVKPNASSSDPKYVVIKLTADHLKIEVTGLPNSPVYFILDVCEDGVVLPKYEGECQTIQQVARIILRPVIYPELYGTHP